MADKAPPAPAGRVEDTGVLPVPSSVPGSMPGTLRAPRNAEPSRMTIRGIGASGFVEKPDAIPAEIDGIVEGHEFVWLDVAGLADVGLIEELGRRFGLHPLALEDVLNTHQRPKSEDYVSTVFVVVRMPIREGPRVRTEQLALFLGRDFVISLHDSRTDCLEPVRERLRRNSGRIRRSGPDYVAYAIVDAVVDSWFPGMDGYAQLLDELDDRIGKHTARRLLARIHALRRDLREIRKTIWKTRDAINFLVRDDTPLVDDETRLYLRDCYDHTIQLVDLVETFRETCTDLRDYHMATVAQRANDVSKLLTIIATIFIPLNFIGALYGMNFESMPELKWHYGYPIALSVMAILAGVLTYVFWRRGWFESDED